MASAIAVAATSCGGDSDDPEIVDNDNPTTTTPTTINGYKFVDLGLPSGTLWAETNIGASTPYEDGDYFAWGEIKTKSSYTESNYKYWGSKYNSTDGKTSLTASDDAATAKWGAGCRIPSTAELKELKSKCSWSWKSNYNGTSGYLVTGPNGNSIFLPAAGMCDDEELEFHGTEGNYWSCQPYSEDKYYAHLLSFGRNDMDILGSDRYLGFSIRPVANKSDNDSSNDDSSQDGQDDDTSPDGHEHKLVDLGLPSGTLWAETNIGASTPYEIGDYFAWGETKAKTIYSWDTYTYGNSRSNLTKYNSTDGKTSLDATDDTATANWGDKYCMPTKEDFLELYKNCKCYYEFNYNGTRGFLVTGPNGNSIFLPATGFHLKNNFYESTNCYYWTSSLYNSISGAHNFDGGSGYCFPANSHTRICGYAVRPIARKKASQEKPDEEPTSITTTIDGHKFVDLGLPSGLLWAECNMGALTPYEDGDYFAWGETKPKTNFTWEDYKWRTVDMTNYDVTKYNSNDKIYCLEAEDDAATENWGNKCSTPYWTDFLELDVHCTSVWKGNGHLIIGPNGNSIFLPAAGYRSDEKIYNKGTQGYYWSCNLTQKAVANGAILRTNSEGLGSYNCYTLRSKGLPIRPVVRKSK